MKKFLLLIALLILAFKIVEAGTPYYQGRITFKTFYYSLVPYGEWIEIDYGVYAWRPIKVSIGWSPYLIGRWVWTPYGWYWDSFEPFGWAVYHYGRWYYDDYYGWIWIPDYDWAPAWVEWRYTDYYIGWAPLPPYASFSISIGIRFSINWYSPHYYWHFVPVKYFCGYEVYRYAVEPKYKYRIYQDSKYSVNYRYDNGRIVNSGIDRNFVERKGGRLFEARIEETTRLRDFTDRRFDEKNRVLVYRPDEKNIDLNSDIRIRKAEREISLDIKKIQTPRERNFYREERRDYEISGGDGTEKGRVIERDRKFNINDNKRNERVFEEKNTTIRPDDNLRIRIENEKKHNKRDENKFNRNIEIPRMNSPKDNNYQKNDRQIEETQIKTQTRIPSMNPNVDEIRKRDLEKSIDRSFDRKRER